jgi:hypothetical protein
MKLNGWRRLAIFFVVLWALSAGAVLTAEFLLDKNVFFTYRMLPKGAVFESGKVTLPDGKEYVIDTRDPIAGRPLMPWEIDWTRYSEIPQFSVLKWRHFLIAAFLVPMLVWAAAELLTVAINWVKEGFRKSKRDS